MRRSSLLAPLIVLLASASASADILPDGMKGASTSIHVDVDGQVPKGKVLVLAATFQGVDFLTPGTTANVDWHPMGGPMQIMAIDEADKGKLEELRKTREWDPIKKLVAKGEACSESFQGVRVLPEKDPADQVRWTYKVSFPDGKCKATLVRTEYLAKSGEVVKTVGDPAPAAPPASGSAVAPDNPATTSTAPAMSVTVAPASTTAAAPPATPAPAGCGCTAAGSAPGQARSLAALLFVGAALMRRRSRK